MLSNFLMVTLLPNHSYAHFAFPFPKESFERFEVFITSSVTTAIEIHHA